MKHIMNFLKNKPFILMAMILLHVHGCKEPDPLFTHMHWNDLHSMQMIVVPVSSDYWISNGDTITKETRTALWCTDKESCFYRLNMKVCTDNEFYDMLYEILASKISLKISNSLYEDILNSSAIRENPKTDSIYAHSGIEGVIRYYKNNGGFYRLYPEDADEFNYIAYLLWNEGIYLMSSEINESWILSTYSNDRRLNSLAEIVNSGQD